MEFGNVADQFLDEHRFADTGAAEQAYLAAFGNRRDQVDDFNAGFQDLNTAGLVDKRRRRTVDRCAGFKIVFQAVDRLAGDIKHPSQRGIADRHANSSTGVADSGATFQTIG